MPLIVDQSPARRDLPSHTKPAFRRLGVATLTSFKGGLMGGATGDCSWYSCTTIIRRHPVPITCACAAGCFENMSGREPMRMRPWHFTASFVAVFENPTTQIYKLTHSVLRWRVDIMHIRLRKHACRSLAKLRDFLLYTAELHNNNNSEFI